MLLYSSDASSYSRQRTVTAVYQYACCCWLIPCCVSIVEDNIWIIISLNDIQILLSRFCIAKQKLTMFSSCVLNVLWGLDFKELGCTKKKTSEWNSSKLSSSWGLRIPNNTSHLQYWWHTVIHCNSFMHFLSNVIQIWCNITLETRWLGQSKMLCWIWVCGIQLNYRYV